MITISSRPRDAWSLLPHIAPRVLLLFLCGWLVEAGLSTAAGQEGDARPFPLNAKRIVFLGDSITHAGTYSALIEMQLRMQHVDPLPEIINVGLSSETCSGLSEPAHPFPRPDVHERLDRVLEKLKPDVVVACYGMNDGIYHPFSEDRFRAYQEGVNRLIEKVHTSGAKLILMTPPVFDAEPLRASGNLKPAGEDEYAYFAMYEDYDSVLKKYAAWIMQQNERVEMTIDLHTPITEHLAKVRETEPGYTVAPDGIHPNEAGHEIIAKTVLRAWGITELAEVPPAVDQAVRQRNAILHDAYLSDIGHQRPGVAAGLPIAEALEAVEAIDQTIAKELAAK